jgi:hypothetical protein
MIVGAFLCDLVLVVYLSLPALVRHPVCWQRGLERLLGKVEQGLVLGQFHPEDIDRVLFDLLVRGLIVGVNLLDKRL